MRAFQIPPLTGLCFWDLRPQIGGRWRYRSSHVLHAIYQELRSHAAVNILSVVVYSNN